MVRRAGGMLQVLLFLFSQRISKTHFRSPFFPPDPLSPLCAFSFKDTCF